MPRLLFFVFLAFLAWLAVRVLGSGRKRDDERGRDGRAAAPPPLAASEPIRQCAWCGVHVPIGQAVALPDGRLYCGEPHRAAAAASTDRSRA
jgi:uncharacterized protein